MTQNQQVRCKIVSALRAALVLDFMAIRSAYSISSDDLPVLHLSCLTLMLIEAFIAAWRDTGGSELANTQSFVNGLCAVLGASAPKGSRTDDASNDYVFERRVFQDNGDGTESFGRIDCYKRGSLCSGSQARQRGRQGSGRQE